MFSNEAILVCFGILTLIPSLIILLYESKHVFYKNIYLKIFYFLFSISYLLSPIYCFLIITSLFKSYILIFGFCIFVISYIQYFTILALIKKSISFNDLVLSSVFLISIPFMMGFSPPSDNKFPMIGLSFIFLFLIYIFLSCINIIIQITKLIRFLKAKRKKKILEIKNKKS